MSDGEFFVRRYANDPVRFVREVVGIEPDEWQCQAANSVNKNQRTAVKSGHGIGKTALIACLVLWFMSTRPNPQILVTANTKNQLDGKTWRELSKWHNASKNKDWFEKTATKFFMKSAPDVWFTHAIPWSENKPDAFQGLHEKHVLVVFDEASGIPAPIWNAVEGAMTTDGARWVAFGNPVNNDGSFFECFHRFKHRWNSITVDSRTAKQADQKQIQQWLEDYGEDSDFFRVKVRGEFPRAGGNQFISHEDITACRNYKAVSFEDAPLIFGVDLARFGDDQSVILPRQGRKVFKPIKWRNMDGMASAAKIAEAWQAQGSKAMCFVDGGGIGGPIVDRLKQLIDPKKVVEVNFGSSAIKDTKYSNRRAEIYGDARDALKDGVELPSDNELVEELGQVRYTFDRQQRILLEKKEDMKARGLSSPDVADAFALTYSLPVQFVRSKEESLRKLGLMA